MSILVKRNSNRDPWFSIHGKYIREGEVVKVMSVEPSDMMTRKHPDTFPPQIIVQRRNSDDNYKYTASLNCFDYVGAIS